jgi:hypothetical protein
MPLPTLPLPRLPVWLPPNRTIPRFFMPPDSIYVSHPDRFALILHHLMAAPNGQSRRQAFVWFTDELDNYPQFAAYFRFWKSQPRETCPDHSMNHNLKVFDAFMVHVREDIDTEQREIQEETFKKQRVLHIELKSFMSAMRDHEDPAIRHQNAVELQARMAGDSFFLEVVEEAIDLYRTAPAYAVPDGSNMAQLVFTADTLQLMVEFAKGTLSPRSLEKYHKLGVFRGGPLGVENWEDPAAGDWREAGAREAIDARVARCEQTGAKKTAESEPGTRAAASAARFALESGLRADAAGAATSAPSASGLQEQMLAIQLDEPQIPLFNIDRSLRYGLTASPVSFNGGEGVSYIDDFE